MGVEFDHDRCGCGHHWMAHPTPTRCSWCDCRPFRPVRVLVCRRLIDTTEADQRKLAAWTKAALDEVER